jgi:peroxiredoxin Q/BCP
MHAPDFRLKDQAGTEHSLRDSSGSWLLLYFYPKDDTPGCTTEACAFRDATADYAKAGVRVLGVSKDGQESHAAFAVKHGLTFPILSDPDAVVIKAYGAWDETRANTVRKSYLIGPDGEIAKEYDNVNVSVHAAQILTDVQAVRKT